MTPGRQQGVWWSDWVPRSVTPVMADRDGWRGRGGGAGGGAGGEEGGADQPNGSWIILGSSGSWSRSKIRGTFQSQATSLRWACGVN